MDAFGWPGIEPRWTHGGKDGVGTAYAASSRVWFTFWNGIVTEVYYPTVDGLLAAMALRLRSGEVYDLDLVDANTARPKWLGAIGGIYIDGREVPADQVEKQIGAMDLILDASGIAELEFNLLDALALNGVYVLAGIPGGDRPIQIPGAELVRQLVLDNQVMLGSVNAARGHFQMAVDDLAQAHLRWGSRIAGLITHRYSLDQFAGLMDHHQPDAIKEVIEWP